MHIEIREKDNEENIDEIVVTNDRGQCIFHLEHMGDWYWLGIYDENNHKKSAAFGIKSRDCWEEWNDLENNQ